MDAKPHPAIQAARVGLDLVFPPTCLVCEEATAAPHGLCAACWRDTPFLSGPRLRLLRRAGDRRSRREPGLARAALPRLRRGAAALALRPRRGAL